MAAYFGDWIFYKICEHSMFRSIKQTQNESYCKYLQPLLEKKLYLKLSSIILLTYNIVVNVQMTLI